MDFSALSSSLRDHPWALTALQLSLVALTVGLAQVLARSLLVAAVTHAVRATPTTWDDALLNSKVLSRLAQVVPALVMYYAVTFVTGLPEAAVVVIRSVASAYVVLAVARSLGSLLNAVNDVYEKRDPERARARPIKGYLQVAKLLLYLITAVLVIATLFHRDPLLLLSGLGAMTAVLMLVFKDTILSLVASVQLSSNDMLRVGDWIAMPQLAADGFVIDISLHTVKVQNWDKTITTIPTWRLISESYKNWRGMFESGGRKIQRALYLDQASVRFLSDAECARLRRFSLLHDYLDRKHEEIRAWNEALFGQGKDVVNSRRLTNLGTFRAYMQAYIEAHPGIHTEMFRLVRQLQPGPTGIPLEIYCYTAKTAWADYEGIQGDLFDHLYAVLPEFGLRVYQQPSGADVVRALRAPTAPEGEPLPEVRANALTS